MIIEKKDGWMDELRTIMDFTKRFFKFQRNLILKMLNKIYLPDSGLE